MRFLENGNFDLNNRNNLILDFYDYYYFFKVLQLEKEGLLHLVANGYELFLAKKLATNPRPFMAGMSDVSL